MALHVEEPCRGKGLGKTLARRLVRDYLKDHGDVSRGVADVFVCQAQPVAMVQGADGFLFPEAE